MKRMKKVLRGLLCLLVWMSAQGAWSIEYNCEEDMKAHANYPYYYCDCRLSDTEFRFGEEIMVNDTAWFKAKIGQLKNGLSAYWFSDCSVKIDVYALCASIAPTISMIVGKDQMREMDNVRIQQKLEEMKDQVATLENMDVHIRVYPIGGGSGTVLAFPYDKGPETSCANALRIVMGMTMVSSNATDVYEFQPKSMVKNRPMYVQWKQKKNQPAEFYITRGTCDGEEVARFTLADSTKVYFPNIQLINSAKDANESLFLHVSHDDSYTGRTTLQTNFKFIQYATDTVICEGKGLQLADTLLTETTQYTQDTVWLRSDSVGIYSYKVTITPAEIEYDTLNVRSAELKKNSFYRGSHYLNREEIVSKGEVDYDFLDHTDGECDTRYLVHVKHIIDTLSVRIDTTICQGKSLVVGGVSYTTDTQLAYEEQRDEDTWTMVDLKVTFSEPEPEYKTIYLTKEQVTDGYRYRYNPKKQSDNILITQFGEQSPVTYTPTGDCAHKLILTVLEDVTSDISETHRQPTPQLIMQNGNVYIRVGDEHFNLLGTRI